MDAVNGDVSDDENGGSGGSNGMRIAPLHLIRRRSPQWPTPDIARDVITKREVRALLRRIGRTPRQRLRWAIDFLQTDLHSPETELEPLRRALAAFLLADMPGLSMIVPKSIELPTPYEVEKCQSEWGMAFHLVFNQVRGERVVSQAMRGKEPDDLKAADRPETLNRPAFTQKIEMGLRITPLRNSSVVEFIPMNDDEGQFEFLFLLGPLTHAVGICPEPECQRYFVAKRLEQTFCSRRCQNRAVVRRKREAERTATSRQEKRTTVMRRRTLREATSG
jgi:hypothetical protein